MPGPELHEIFNTSWWAKALFDHRTHDALVHIGERAHQKRDPDARELHTEDHELTAFEKHWVAERVKDKILEHCTAGNKAAEVLAEDADAHEARVQHAAALDHFGSSHEDLLTKAHARKKTHPDEAAQIDERIHYVHRHMATKRAEVVAARELAAEHRMTAEKIVMQSFDTHVERFTAQVQDGIRVLVRAAAAEARETLPADEPAAEPADDPAEEAMAEAYAELRAEEPVTEEPAIEESSSDEPSTSFEVPSDLADEPSIPSEVSPELRAPFSGTLIVTDEEE